jgi:hypothetical protein
MRWAHRLPKPRIACPRCRQKCASTRSLWAASERRSHRSKTTWWASPTSVQTLAITDLKLDEALQDYGPEAAEGHRILREGIKNTIAEIWKNSDDEQAVIHKFGYARANLKARLALLNALQPASDQQTADPISYSLISVVVA